MTRTAPCRLLAGLVSAAALIAPALADGPVQTDYDAQFYMLDSNSGEILAGSLAMATPDTAFDSPIGNLASGLDFYPDGRLVAAGDLDGLGMVLFIDPETADTIPIISTTDVDPLATVLTYFRGVTIAPDGTIYTFMAQLGSNITKLVHFTQSGEILSASIVQDAAGTPIYWNSRAFTVRPDGVIVTVETELPSLAPSIKRVGTIDPDTGVLEVLSVYSEEGAVCRGLARVGETAFVNLSKSGNQIYTLDLYTGALSYVVTVEGLSAGYEAFGFAIAPDPCAADMTYDDALNLGDIETFVNRFLEGSTAADLDYSRTNNFDDLDLFVDSYLAGCDD